MVPGKIFTLRRIVSVIAIFLVVIVLAHQVSPAIQPSQRSSAYIAHPSQQSIQAKTGKKTDGLTVRSIVLANNTLFDTAYTNPINGVGPEGIAFDSSSRMIYVADATTDSVSCINSTTLNVTASISLGTSPCAVMYDSQNGYIYVINSVFTILYVIDPSINVLAGTIKLAAGNSTNASSQTGSQHFIFSPMGFDPVNGNIMVTDYNSGVNTLLNSNNTIRGRVYVGNYTKNVVYDMVTGYFYETYGNGIAVINSSTGAVKGSFSNISSQQGIITSNPENGNIYVSDSFIGYASTIDVSNNSVIRDYVPNFGTSSMIYDAVINDLIMVGDSTNSLSIVNPVNRTVISSVLTGNSPLDCCISPFSGAVYVTDFTDNTVMEINPGNASVASTAVIGTSPINAAYQKSSGTLFISAGTEVLFLNTTSDNIFSSVPVPEGAINIALDPATNLLYVTGPTDVTVINATTGKEANIVQNIDPLGITYDPGNGNVYVSSPMGIIFFHNSSTPGGVIDSGLTFNHASLNNLAFDRFTGRIIVSSADNVTLINTSSQHYRRIDLNSGNLGVVYPISASTIIVCSSSSGYAYILNSTGAVEQKTIRLGGIVSSMSLDPANGYLYSVTSDGIDIINTANDTLIGNMLQGSSLNGSLFVSNNSTLYVMNPSQGVVYILMPTQSGNGYYFAIVGLASAALVILAGLLLSSRRRNKKKNP